MFFLLTTHKVQFQTSKSHCSDFRLFQCILGLLDYFSKLSGWVTSVSGPFEGISYCPREILVSQFCPERFVAGLLLFCCSKN